MANPGTIHILRNHFEWEGVELVSKELNHLPAILHVYGGGLIFMKEKKMLLFFKKKREILLHF